MENIKTDEKTLREQAEDILSLKASQMPDDLSADELRSIVHELELQNTELKLKNTEYCERPDKYSEMILHSKYLESKIKEQIVEIVQLSAVNQTIIKSLNLAVITTNFDGLITGFNKEAEILLGYRADEMIGISNVIVIHKEEDIVDVANKVSLESGIPIKTGIELLQYICDKLSGNPHEWTLIRKDGSEVPVLLSLSQLIDANGITTGYLGVAFDNSVRKAEEEELRISEQRFYKMFTDHSAVMLLIHPDTGDIIDANNAAKNYYGFTFDSSHKFNIDDLNLKSKNDIRKEMQAALLHKKNTFYLKHRVKNEVRTVEVNSSPIEYSGQKILFSIIFDVTEQRKAEELLRWNEYLLQLMSDSSPFGFLVTDRHSGRILYFNQRFCSLWKLTSSEEELKRAEMGYNKFISSIIPLIKETESLSVLGIDMGDSTENGLTMDELQLIDGRTIGIFVTQIKGEYDEYLGHFYIFEDITERKRTEKKLQLQTAAFESVALAVVITDLEGYIIWVNPAFTKLTGYPVDEVVGQHTRILKSGKMEKSFYEELWDSILSGKVWTNELINKRKDGTYYNESQTITPIFNDQGEVTRFISVKIDITHRIQMESALRVSEARWQAALEGSGYGIWDHNIITGEVFYSSKWKSMLGYSDEDIKNISEEWFSRIHPEDLPKCTELLKSHYRGETEFFTDEYRMRCKDGTYKWILDRGKVIEWVGKGKPSRVIGTHSDIDDRKRLEASLKESIEKEKELNEMKSRFVSTASHEFRTPLSSILITSDSLLTYWERMENNQIKDKLAKINNQVLHLTKIVNDVLQLSRIEEGKVEFHPVDIDIIDLCKQVLDSFNSDPKLINKVNFVTPFNSVIMRLDSRLIFQVINNLISNGIKYTPENPIIKVEITRKNHELCIIVSDNGIGIPEADQKHLFKPFFRGSNTSIIQGNGLGLSIVKESVMLHGGNISFRSRLGQGTTFTILFPDSLIRSYE